MKATVLDLDRPLASLREAAGLTSTELAKLRGVKLGSHSEAEGIGRRINLATLLDAAKVAGLRVEIRVLPEKET